MREFQMKEKVKELEKISFDELKFKAMNSSIGLGIKPIIRKRKTLEKTVSFDKTKDQPVFDNEMTPIKENNEKIDNDLPYNICLNCNRRQIDCSNIGEFQTSENQFNRLFISYLSR